MKKQTLILAAGLTLASLLLSGCGNEAKFNTAKDNFLKLAKEFHEIDMNSNEPCSKLHTKYKKAYDIMLKADKELKEITVIAQNNKECKTRLQENWRAVSGYKLDKELTIKVGKFHKKTHKCNLEGLNLDIE